ncbi:MAG: hypothetical protein EOM91_15855 [Sphingobacteriia bacterium]|nr:hypothetical protein [Sphingobacteriia bacterium]NCC41109.1 hypothetical protein [Gammaproteobacteria bacterium]
MSHLIVQIIILSAALWPIGSRPRKSITHLLAVQIKGAVHRAIGRQPSAVKREGRVALIAETFIQATVAMKAHDTQFQRTQVPSEVAANDEYDDARSDDEQS